MYPGVSDVPRPDYYRYLPSYFDDDPDKYAWAVDGWRYNSNVQHINWDRLYDVNRNSTFDEGIDYNPAIDISNASRSKYILEERRTDQNDINVTGQVTKTFGSIFPLEQDRILQDSQGPARR